MTQNYPYTKCLHPRIVVNQFTGQEIAVGCGVCKACLMNKANKMSFLCSLEEQDHKYCMFFTLTYSPEYLPTAVGVIDKHSGLVRFVSQCDRLHDKGKVICFDYDGSHACRSYLTVIYHKCKLDDCISYTSVREMQLFIKRLRKYVSKRTQKSFRYYAVSEYGPKTFRAHYHGMLFTDDRQVCEILGKGIRSCWKFGRVDYSLSRGQCSSYVARYVNSTYFIPPFLANGSSKPFSLHSWFFAQGFYRRKKKEIYENEPRSFVRVGRSVSGRFVDFMPWRSLASTFFPRCKNFNGKSIGELYRSYTILQRCEQAFGTSFPRLSLGRIAETIVDVTHDALKDINGFKQMLSIFGNVQGTALRDVSRFFIDSIGRSEFLNSFSSSDDRERLVSKVCSELYISRHFMDFVCDHHTVFEYKRKLKMIIDYWSSRNYENLVSMYRSQEELSQKYPDMFSDMLPFFYVNSAVPLSELDKTIVYKNFSVDTDMNFNRSIKHKKQNDLNLIFIN